MALVAQCTPQWLPGVGLSGVLGAGGNGGVRATAMWDPDGAGPLTPRLVVGGDFTSAGSVAAGNIAFRDVATGDWSALGSQMDRPVNALAVLPNGDLVAGGQFTIGGLPANGIGRWNGSVWLPLGSGILGSVNALAVLPNGDLVAGGDLWSAGGVATNSIARWNGSTWSTLGSGISGSVDALAVLPNGDLVAGGQFFAAGGVVANGIARWDGSTWSPLGSGMNGGSAAIAALAVLPNGDLVAGGFFGSAGGVVASSIARWDGSTWSPLGSGVDFRVHALAVLPNGNLCVGGRFQNAGGVGALSIASWDGSSWSPLGSGMLGDVATLVVLPNGELVAGGDFTAAGGVDALGLARWNGSAWSVLGSEVNGAIRAFASLPNGDLIAGGDFTAAGGVNARHIARWNGSAWFELGGGLGVGLGFGVSPTQGVIAVAVLPNGDVVAGGDFGIAGGAAANGIARWNGSTWSTLGSGIGGTAFVSVSALAVLPNGDLVAGGSFTSAGGVSTNRIARWDGITWSPLGSGMNDTVAALVVLPNGDLVAGGAFTTAGGVSANRIARWDGTSWSALGSGVAAASFAYVLSFAVLPNGDLVAGGAFTIAGGTAANGIARWDGSAWSALGLGLGSGGGATALAMLPSGQLAVGGGFLTAGGQPSACFARYATPCPAVATTSGAGCASSGGTNTLAAVTLPWVDATYRTRGTGLPSLAVVAVVNGLSTVAIPLAAVLPPSPASCSLLVVPDLVDAVLTTTGTVDAQLALPNTPSLAGTVLHQQFVVLQLDASGSFVQVTSTNRLTATIGSF